MEELKEKIVEFIESRREDDYYDFKQYWEENESENKNKDPKSDLLHDIICMANNKHIGDSYIIFGVEDKTYNITGVENDINRKNQQQIIDFLKDKKFESGVRPQIELKTISLEGHLLDVLIVKESTDTPYYLTERFNQVEAYHIYTRVGDTNTPKSKNADINYVEYLWKKRFLLTVSPIRRIFYKLKYKEEWIEKYNEEKDCEIYFNIYNPEYTINITEDNEKLTQPFYNFVMTNDNSKYGILKIKYFETEIYSCQCIYLDSSQYITSVPEWSFLELIDKMNVDYGYKYFIKESELYLIHKFLYDEDNFEQDNARRRLYDVIVIYNSKEEKELFEEYIYSNKEKFIKMVEEKEKEFEYVEFTDELEGKDFRRKASIGTVLNEILKEYRVRNRR